MTISIVISYVTLFVSVILAVFYTPFVLESLGDTQYGIRSFATALVGYLSFLSIGLATSYLRFANIAKQERGEEGEKHINGIFFAFYLTIAAIAAVLGIVLVLFVAYRVIPLNLYTDQEITNWIVPIMLISVVGTVIEFPGIVFRLILTYKKKFIWINVLALISTIASPLISIIVLIYGGGSVGITWVGLGISVGTVIMNGLYVFFGLKSKITFKFDERDRFMFKEIVIFSLIVFVISTLSQLNLITNKVILGFVLGSSAVALYQISTTFNAYISSITTAITGVFAPRLTEDAVAGRMDSVQYIYDFVIKVVMTLVAMIVFGFLACGFEFVSAWLPDSYSSSYQDIYWYSFVILGSNILILGQTFTFYIQRALNKNLIPAIIYAIVFVLNVSISIALCYVLGIWGCIIGTVFSFTVEAVSLSYYNSKVIKLKQKTYWKATFLSVIYGFISAIIVSVIFGFKPFNISFLIDLNDFTNIGQMLVKGFSYVFVFAIIEVVFNRRFLKEFFYTFFNRKPFPLDKELPLQVLIPTMFKDGEEEIRKLLLHLNVDSPTIVANQTNRESTYSFDYNGNEITVIDTKTRGVSVNRNILLDNLKASIGLFIDDDCALLPNYEETITIFFFKNKNHATFFNGLIKSGRKINNKHTTYVIRFKDLSHSGGTGFAISKAAVEKFKPRFNEKLGTPNYIYSGEDSFFVSELIKKRMRIFRSSKLIFDIIEDDEKSSYFKGFDEQFFISKGAVTKLIHPCLFRIYEIYYSYSLREKTSRDHKFIYENMKKGERFVQKRQIVYDDTNGEIEK